MASALNTKINSYALERGMELNETPTAAPTRTGTNGLGTWTVRNTANILFEPTVGPPGGAGSTRFTAVPSTGGAFETTSLVELANIDDEDWTIGIWFKVNPLPNYFNTTGTVAGLNILRLTPNNNSQGFVASVTPMNITSSEHAGRMIYNMTSSNSVKSPIVTANTWHYTAVRRLGTTMEVYYDGVLIGTEENPMLTAAAARLAFGNQSNGNFGSPMWWASNFHMGPASVLNPTAIAEIWAVGSGGTTTPTRTVKYYNGTAWVNSSAQKVYNGTAWVDWTAKKYNGTAWVTI